MTSIHHGLCRTSKTKENNHLHHKALTKEKQKLNSCSTKKVSKDVCVVFHQDSESGLAIGIGHRHPEGRRTPDMASRSNPAVVQPRKILSAHNDVVSDGVKHGITTTNQQYPSTSSQQMLSDTHNSWKTWCSRYVSRYKSTKLTKREVPSEKQLASSNIQITHQIQHNSICQNIHSLPKKDTSHTSFLQV